MSCSTILKLKQHEEKTNPMPFGGYRYQKATALSLAPSKQCSETNVNVPTEVQGRGRCTYGTCKCPAFKQRPGYYQCWCGHQSFVHK